MRMLFPFAVVALFIATPVLASQDGVVVRSATVYSKADIGSEQIGEISAGTRISIFSRKGGWKEIFAEDLALVGWVRGFQVREGDYAPEVKSGEQADSRGFLSGLAAFSRKASSFFGAGGGRTSSGTATIGVRGLSEAQIKSAQPNFEELEKLQGFVSTPARVSSFRKDGQLQKFEVEHIQSQTGKAAAAPTPGNPDK